MRKIILIGISVFGIYGESMAASYYTSSAACEQAAASLSASFVNVPAGTTLTNPCGTYTSWTGENDTSDDWHPSQTYTVVYNCQKIASSKWDIYEKSVRTTYYGVTPAVKAPNSPSYPGWGECYSTPYIKDVVEIQKSLCPNGPNSQAVYISKEEYTMSQGSMSIQISTLTSPLSYVARAVPGSKIKTEVQLYRPANPNLCNPNNTLLIQRALTEFNPSASSWWN